MRSDRVQRDSAPREDGRRELRRSKRRTLAVGVLIFCAFIVVTASPAEAAPALSVTPSTNLTDGQTVTVTGSGFTPASLGGVIQCSTATGQPTIAVLGNSIPVSCTNPVTAIVSADASGNVSKSFVVKTGTTGPPAAGTDSSGASAATSAAAYPCPPTPAQIAAGATCTIAFGNQAGEQATANITFQGQGSSSSSSSSSASTSSASSSSGSSSSASSSSGSSSSSSASSSSSSTSASSSTASSSLTSSSSSSPAAPSAPSIAVDPSTDLEDGQKVVVTGRGFTPGVGSLIQCSDDPQQPTVSALGNDVPVSCSDPLLLLVTADANGDLPPTEVVVQTGTVGPPAAGTDSAGAADDYPCPPTAAQIDAGVSCVIAYGNLAGERATAKISFAGESGTAPTVLGNTATPGSAALPKTGMDAGLLRSAALAVGLLDLGYLVLSSTWTDRLSRKGGGGRRARIRAS